MERKGIAFLSLFEIFLIVIAGTLVVNALLIAYHKKMRKKQLLAYQQANPQAQSNSSVQQNTNTVTQ